MESPWFPFSDAPKNPEETEPLSRKERETGGRDGTRRVFIVERDIGRFLTPALDEAVHFSVVKSTRRPAPQAGDEHLRDRFGLVVGRGACLADG